MEALCLQGCPCAVLITRGRQNRSTSAHHKAATQAPTLSTSPFVRSRSLSKKFRVLQAHDPPHQIRPLVRIQPLARARSFKENPEAASKRCAPLPAAREEKEGDEPPFLRQRPEAFKRRCYRSWPQEPSAGALASLAAPCLRTAWGFAGVYTAHRLHLEPGGLPSAPNGPQPPGGPRRPLTLLSSMCAASPGPAAPARGAHRSRPPRRTPALTTPQRGPRPPPWPAALFVYSRPPRPGSGGGAVHAGKSSLARPRRHWPLPRWRGGKNYISQQAPQGWGGERRDDWLPSGRENYISQKAPGACAPSFLPAGWGGRLPQRRRPPWGTWCRRQSSPVCRPPPALALPPSSAEQ